jgi:hypothetical protein
VSLTAARKCRGLERHSHLELRRPSRGGMSCTGHDQCTNETSPDRHTPLPVGTPFGVADTQVLPPRTPLDSTSYKRRGRPFKGSLLVPSYTTAELRGPRGPNGGLPAGNSNTQGRFLPAAAGLFYFRSRPRAAGHERPDSGRPNTHFGGASRPTQLSNGVICEVRSESVARWQNACDTNMRCCCRHPPRGDETGGRDRTARRKSE